MSLTLNIVLYMYIPRILQISHWIAYPRPYRFELLEG
jgi:hypothetical protein